MMFSLQGTKRARRPSIAVQYPNPSAAPAITRSNNRVHSEDAWMDKDERRNAIRFKNYLDYSPRIVLPLTLCSLRKPLTKAAKNELEEKTEKLLAPSRPARCTSTQYLDRNGDLLLYYFRRHLIRLEDKKVSFCPLLLRVQLTCMPVRTSVFRSRINIKIKQWRI